MAASPTSRTLAELKAAHISAQVVERWNPHANRRVDLFGFIDIVAISPEGIVGIQATSGANHASRKEKIVTERTEAARAWLEAGGRIEVWSWKKYAKPVDRKRWRARVESVTLEDLRDG